jgi:hypothetical protein
MIAYCTLSEMERAQRIGKLGEKGKLCFLSLPNRRRGDSYGSLYYRCIPALQTVETGGCNPAPAQFAA